MEIIDLISALQDNAALLIIIGVKARLFELESAEPEAPKTCTVTFSGNGGKTTTGYMKLRTRDVIDRLLPYTAHTLEWVEV